MIGRYAVLLLAALLALMLGAVMFLRRWIEKSSRTFRKRIGPLQRAAVETPTLLRLRRRFPRLWTFLARRFSPEGVLGLYLTAGLSLVVAALFLFMELAEELWDGEEMAHFDRALAEALHQHASPAALIFFHAVTRLGDLKVITALGAAVGVMLIVRREWLLLTGWAVALAGAGLLNLELKAFFQRARPGLPNPFITESGWSFPSGHAMGALVAYGMLAYLLAVLFDGKARRFIFQAAGIVTFLIGTSRLYLGVHYFSDVIAGYAAGMAWLAVCITGTEIARRHRQAQSSRPAPQGTESLT